MYSCGLVLEGGGNRAIYTSGVLDAFMDQGIVFPYVIGVSAGSCNAVSYIGKCRGRQHDISIQYSGDKRFMSLENMIKNGEFLNGEWLFGELSYDLSPLDQEAYDRANTTLCVVVTNALTGKAEYMYPKDFHKRGCPILRASCPAPPRGLCWAMTGTLTAESPTPFPWRTPTRTGAKRQSWCSRKIEIIKSSLWVMRA